MPGGESSESFENVGSPTLIAFAFLGLPQLVGSHGGQAIDS